MTEDRVDHPNKTQSKIRAPVQHFITHPQVLHRSVGQVNKGKVKNNAGINQRRYKKEYSNPQLLLNILRRLKDRQFLKHR